MVHIILEHLLSTSSNRLLYESLWNLAITKNCKYGNLKGFQDQNIPAICSDLIQEIKKDDPDRAKFYFSTQIVFGTLVLYRLQVDKLYDQAKHALASYNATFYKINWLSQIGNYPSDVEPSQQKTKKGVKNSTQQKRTQENLKKSNIDNDFDLIERVLEISQAAEPKHKKGKRSRKAQGRDEEDPTLDPTMAISVNQITINEGKEMKNSTGIATFGIDDEDFGSFGPVRNLSLDYPTIHQSNSLNQIVYDQEVPEVFVSSESPDQLRNATFLADNPTMDYDMSLSANIQEILDNHKKPLKRRSSNSYDISLRLEPPKKQARFDEDIRGELEDNNIPEQVDTIIPSFENISNDVGIDEVPKTSTDSNLVHDTYDVSSPSNFIDLALVTSNDQIVQARQKTRKIKSKVFEDKQTKIKDETLLGSFALYKKKLVLDSPIDTFELQSLYTKSAVAKLFHTPASRLRICALELLPVFERNLKKLSSNLLKRKIHLNSELESSHESKRPRIEQKKELAVKKVVFDEEDKTEDEYQLVVPADLEIVVPATDLDPTLADHPTVTDYPLPNFEDVSPVALVDLPIGTRALNDGFEASPTVASPMKSKSAKRTATMRKYSDDSVGYKECEKWSKKKIMNNLKGYWKQKDTSITMEKLTSQTNRFVAAGIFFELMVLSKAGAVELIQGSDLTIVNISAGKQKKIYM